MENSIGIKETYPTEKINRENQRPGYRIAPKGSTKEYKRIKDPERMTKWSSEDRQEFRYLIQ